MGAGQLAAVELRRIENFLESGRLDDAEEILDAALNAGLQDADVFHLKGLARSFRRDYEAAAHWLEEAIRTGGPRWLFLKNLGVMNYHLGHIEAAIDCFTRTLQAQPKDYETYGFLSDAQTFRERPELLDTIESVMEKHRLNSLQLANLHFAAGKIYDDLGDPDKAFAHFQLGNENSRRRADLAALEREARALIESYTRDYFDKVADQGMAGVSPVFVVGMPRSGTSLMEQIIANHPMGKGVGELPDLALLRDDLDRRLASEGGYPRGLWNAAGGFRTTLAKSYLESIRRMVGDVRSEFRIVDKSPLNFWRIGLIAELFPDAKIIHMRRDPLDTCLSCYFTKFVSNQDFAFDLVSLGHYYVLYERLMSHWEEVLPERFITVDYEALVQDITGQGGRVIDYIELQWDDHCAHPHLAKNPMQSASARQVRQPVYTTSIGRWKRYRSYLQPLIECLEEGRDALRF